MYSSYCYVAQSTPLVLVHVSYFYLYLTYLDLYILVHNMELAFHEMDNHERET